MPAVQSVLNSTSDQTGSGADTGEETHLVNSAKKIALLSIGIAYQKFGTDLEKQQEVMMSISDVVMESFAMESSLLRSRKLRASGKGTTAGDMCAVFLRSAMDRVECSARAVVGACSTGDSLPENMRALRSLAVYDPIDAVRLRRTIANRLLADGRYNI